jgi:hypothetical protein
MNVWILLIYGSLQIHPIDWSGTFTGSSRNQFWFWRWEMFAGRRDNFRHYRGERNTRASPWGWKWCQLLIARLSSLVFIWYIGIWTKGPLTTNPDYPSIHYSRFILSQYFLTNIFDRSLLNLAETQWKFHADTVNAFTETHSDLVRFNVIQSEPIKMKIPSLKLFQEGISGL